MTGLMLWVVLLVLLVVANLVVALSFPSAAARDPARRRRS
jgi:hypothetical protein